MRNLFRIVNIQASNCKPNTIQQVLKLYSNQLDNSKAMELIVPRAFSEASLAKLTHNQKFTNGQNHLNSLNKVISQPIWDLLDRGGKRWRPVLCFLIAQLFGHKRDQVIQIASLCQIIHNGTLLIDDIEDSSTVRRSKPCVHLIYGIDIAVNAGNFMYFAPLLALSKCGKFNQLQLATLYQIYFEEMVQLHLGQGWDILWHNSDRLQKQYPTQCQYLQMTAHKTGVLARLASRMVCQYLGVNSSQTKALIQFVESLGVAFQIQDDLLNLEGEQFKKAKGYNGEDIHQGKITLMVIHYLQTGRNKERLIEILIKKSESESEIKEAIDLLRQNGSLSYARAKMNELIDKSILELDRHFVQSPGLDLIKQLAYYGIKREK